MRPKCVVAGFICEGNCSQCDLMDANLGCMNNEFTPAEKIAALTDALKELGYRCDHCVNGEYVSGRGRKFWNCDRLQAEVDADFYCSEYKPKE